MTSWQAVCGESLSGLEAQHKYQRETNVRFMQPQSFRQTDLTPNVSRHIQ